MLVSILPKCFCLPCRRLTSDEIGFIVWPNRCTHCNDECFEVSVYVWKDFLGRRSAWGSPLNIERRWMATLKSCYGVVSNYLCMVIYAAYHFFISSGLKLLFSQKSAQIIFFLLIFFNRWLLLHKHSSSFKKFMLAFSSPCPSSLWSLCSPALFWDWCLTRVSQISASTVSGSGASSTWLTLPYPSLSTGSEVRPQLKCHPYT